MNTILEQCLSLIDLGQLEKEIKTNPTTKFEEKDIEAIKNGELDVIIYVAELYAVGSEVITPNPKLALEICRLCIDAGYTDGYGLLADFYEKGLEVEKDYRLSLMTLLEGAKKGSPYCMVKLANRNQKHRICFDGKSINDEEEEFQWLYSAAELGYAPSYIPLGLRYQCGSGTEQSKDKAEYWFNKAKEAGIETSMDYLIHLWQETWSEKYNVCARREQRPTNLFDRAMPSRRQRCMNMNGNKVQDRNSPRKRPNR